MEKGQLSSLQGKSLDEIEIEIEGLYENYDFQILVYLFIHEFNSYPLPDEIPLSDHEDGGSENDDSCTAVPISGLRTVQSEDVDSTLTKEVNDDEDFGR